MRALLALLAVAAPIQAFAAQADEDRVLFYCRIGDARVEVTRDGDRMTYRFAAPGTPETVLTGDPAAGTLLHRSVPIAYGQGHILRFREGARSVAVYSYFEVDVGAGGRDQREAGVLLLEGERVVERRKCRPTNWRDEEYDPLEGNWRYVLNYDALPVDPLELYPMVYKSLYRPKRGGG